MKNTIQQMTIVLFCASMTFVSCKKDKPSPSEILIAGTCWQTVLLEGYDTANNTWVAVSPEDCEADNCFNFKNNNTFTVEEGALKCDPGDPQIAEGSWSISGDGKTLSLSDGSATDVGTIVEITTGKLVFEQGLDEEKIRITLRTKE